MRIECSRYTPLFNIILFAQLVVSGFGERRQWNTSENSNYGRPANSNNNQIENSNYGPPANSNNGQTENSNNGQPENSNYVPPANSSYGESPQPGRMPYQPVVQSPPTYNSNCNFCTISVSSVSLYYWPQESTNTACLATLLPQPSVTIPSGLDPSPSAYALFFSVTINNACGLYSTYPTSTASFDQNSLSTLDIGGHARSFNLADLPCPPPGVSVEPGQPYMPSFAWNDELFFKGNADPPECLTIAGLNAWQDPPVAFTSTTGLAPPHAGAPRPGRHRREHANAHMTSWVPARTTTVP